MQGAGFRMQGAGFRVQGLGCRVQGSGFTPFLASSPDSAIVERPILSLPKVDSRKSIGQHHRGTSLIRTRLPPGPYSSPVPGGLVWS